MHAGDREPGELGFQLPWPQQPGLVPPAPPAPLPRRQPQAAAPAAGAAGWSADADNAASHDAAAMPVYSSVRRPKVSCSPPWDAWMASAARRGVHVPRVPCGPPAASHCRARPRLPVTRPGIPGRPRDADQRRRNLPSSRASSGGWSPSGTSSPILRFSVPSTEPHPGWLARTPVPDGWWPGQGIPLVPAPRPEARRDNSPAARPNRTRLARERS